MQYALCIVHWAIRMVLKAKTLKLFQTMVLGWWPSIKSGGPLDRGSPDLIDLLQHQSRPALRPTQPPVQWVPGLLS